MKKKVQMLVGGLALAAIVGVNGYMATSTSIHNNSLSMDDVEALGYDPGEAYSVNYKEATESMKTIHCTFTKNIIYGNVSFGTVTEECDYEVKYCAGSSGRCYVVEKNCVDYWKDWATR